jgi:hypothetical protein
LAFTFQQPKDSIMKSKQEQPKEKDETIHARRFTLCLPPGTSLSDFFIDGSQVIQELYITKRTLLNWRGRGKLSYTDEFGKIFYFKQEIARILLEGKKRREKKQAKKNTGK